MNEADVVHLGGQALLLCAKLVGPLLVVCLVIGVVTSLLQAVFQVQDATLAMVPKLIGAAVVLTLGGGWMLHTLVDFTSALFAQIPDLVSRS